MTTQVIENGNISDEAQEGNVTIEKSNVSKSAAQNASKNKPVPTRKQQIEAAAKAELPNGAAVGTISKIQSLGEYLIISVKTEDGVKPVVVSVNADTQALAKGDDVAFGGGVYQRQVLKADGAIVEQPTLLAQTLEAETSASFYVTQPGSGKLQQRKGDVYGVEGTIFGGLIGSAYREYGVVIACSLGEVDYARTPQYVAESQKGDLCFVRGTAVINLTTRARTFRKVTYFRNATAVERKTGKADAAAKSEAKPKNGGGVQAVKIYRRIPHGRKSQRPAA